MLLLIPDWVYNSSDSLFVVVISAIVIFIAIIVFVRLSGLQTFSKMSSFDFAITIAIGSVLASTVVSKSTSLVQGVMALGSLIGLQALVSYLSQRSDKVENLITNQPVFLMIGEEVLHKNLRATRINESELIAKLREANVVKTSQIKAVVLETTGDISVLHSDDDSNIDDYILTGVQRKA